MMGRRAVLPPYAALALVGLGAFVTALDQTVVVTALPSVMLDLRIPLVELNRASWIVTAYLLGYTVAMPVVARIADVYGYSRTYKASLVVFTTGTCLVAVSPNFEWIVGARVVQAVGGGATVPIGMAIAAASLPRHQQGLALGVVGASAEAGSMLGPAYGGAIIEWLDWRWIFWLNVPQAAALFLGLLWLPNRSDRGTGPAPGVDYLGGCLLVAALLVLSLALSRQSLFQLTSPFPFLALGGALGLLAVLALLESRTRRPLLTPVMFRSLGFVSANATQLLVGTSLVVAMVTAPLLANTVMGRDPLTGAMWLLRMTAAVPVGAVIGGLLLGRVGVRPVTLAGLAMAAAGMLLAAGWDLEVADPELTLHLALAGFGFGLVITPIVSHALDSVGEDYRATAASLVVVSRMLGMTLGLAALSAWGIGHFQALTAGLEFPIALLDEPAAEFAARQVEYSARLTGAGLALFHDFFRVSAGAALLAIVPALAMRRGPVIPEEG